MKIQEDHRLQRTTTTSSSLSMAPSSKNEVLVTTSNCHTLQSLPAVLFYHICSYLTIRTEISDMISLNHAIHDLLISSSACYQSNELCVNTPVLSALTKSSCRLVLSSVPYLHITANYFYLIQDEVQQTEKLFTMKHPRNKHQLLLSSLQALIISASWPIDKVTKLLSSITAKQILSMLKTLYIGNHYRPLNGLPFLAHLPVLETLILHTRLDGHVLTDIFSCKQLKHLDISGCERSSWKTGKVLADIFNCITPLILENDIRLITAHLCYIPVPRAGPFRDTAENLLKALSRSTTDYPTSLRELSFPSKLQPSDLSILAQWSSLTMLDLNILLLRTDAIKEFCASISSSSLPPFPVLRGFSVSNVHHISLDEVRDRDARTEAIVSLLKLIPGSLDSLRLECFYAANYDAGVLTMKSLYNLHIQGSGGATIFSLPDSQISFTAWSNMQSLYIYGIAVTTQKLTMILSVTPQLLILSLWYTNIHLHGIFLAARHCPQLLKMEINERQLQHYEWNEIQSSYPEFFNIITPTSFCSSSLSSPSSVSDPVSSICPFLAHLISLSIPCSYGLDQIDHQIWLLPLLSLFSPVSSCLRYLLIPTRKLSGAMLSILSQFKQLKFLVCSSPYRSIDTTDIFDRCTKLYTLSPYNGIKSLPRYPLSIVEMREEIDRDHQHCFGRVFRDRVLNDTADAYVDARELYLSSLLA